MKRRLIAIIVEGGSERTIINLLLENNLLKFQTDDLLDGRPISERNGSKFAKKFLTLDLENKMVSIIRVLDSHNEKFKLSEPYRKKIDGDPTDIYTSPEIEILFIIYMGDYERFKNQKSGRKLTPNAWCKRNYKMKNVKSPEFVRNFWESRLPELVEAIGEYSKLSKDPFEHTLASLLK